MAFNFNWSPLAADAGFYTRAQELLTTALNKSPKPPIIVDDILVNELNLGHVPPELEILEIGDLAEDRFRGIFKMSYNGDAFLTLKTRVQANPLNTYLLTRPAFASPQPLAAATGLTIPLQITLSDIRLSAIIILVFSRQKGLTLVFRNDPLESLKVSSTFDSIPFVANYLQKEIEGQLRILLMDELPPIIHRLSLRLWVPEYQAREEDEMNSGQPADDEPIVDPLASPPEDPVDSTGHPLTPSQVASLSLDSAVETQSLFSQKNLLRLATLTDSQRTLSLFTPPIRDAVFRAWAGPMERGEFAPFQTRSATPALSRTHSYAGGLAATHSLEGASLIRPGLSSFSSGTHGLATGAGRHSRGHGTRKKKKRIVNLRKQIQTGEGEINGEDAFGMADTGSVTESTSSAQSVFSAPPATTSFEAYRTLDSVTPFTSPTTISRNGKAAERSATTMVPTTVPFAPATPPRRSTADYPARPRAPPSLSSRDNPGLLQPPRNMSAIVDIDATPRASMYLPEKNASASPTQATAPIVAQSSKMEEGESSKPVMLPNLLQFIADPSIEGSIAERAWMAKIFSEVARRYGEEQEKSNFVLKDDDAPPAYAR